MKRGISGTCWGGGGTPGWGAVVFGEISGAILKKRQNIIKNNMLREKGEKESKKAVA